MTLDEADTLNRTIFHNLGSVSSVELIHQILYIDPFCCMGGGGGEKWTCHFHNYLMKEKNNSLISNINPNARHVCVYQET